MTCPVCHKPTYTDGSCAGCLEPAADCKCVAASIPKKAKKPRKPREATVWDRMPIELRAGTHVDQHFAIPIFGTSKRGTMRHGTLLKNMRVYQCGGEIDNFVYWKEHAVTIAYDVWLQIRDGVVREGRRYGADVIEVVDHRRNRVWRVDMSVARERGRAYEDSQHSIGKRWAIHLDYGLWEQGELPPKKGAPLDPPPEAPPRLL